MKVYENWSKSLRVFVYVCIYCRIFGPTFGLTSNYCTVCGIQALYVLNNIFLCNYYNTHTFFVVVEGQGV